MKNLPTTKSNDQISDLFRGQASRPYISINILVKIIWIFTISDAIRPTLTNMLFSAHKVL